MSEREPRSRLTAIDEVRERTVYRDESRGTYHVWCDRRTAEPVTAAIPRLVSAVRGIEPATLEALGDRVDPDALNAIFARPRGGQPRAYGWVRFAYAGCSVTVHSDGEIAVEPVDRGDESA